MTRIAVLDDDAAILEAVERLTRDAGFESVAFTSGRDLIRCLHRENFELFVLDWQVPDLSGLHVLEWIRNGIGSQVPVVLLTNRAADDDVVAGLQAGADDFVTKPFQPAVLLARLQALLRRSTGAPSKQSERFGRYVFHVAGRTVTIESEEILLTQKEFSLSMLLFRNLNCALSRAHALETVWGIDPDVSTRTLDSHISRIRAKLQLEPANGFKLSTIYGYGYRLEEVAE
ncbi:MAG: response regulator transcription factor [Novosphingobium sp.]